MNTLAVITAVWGRPDITGVVLRHYARLSVKLRAEGLVDLVLLAAVSTGTDVALCKASGWDVVTTPNEPLSDKWNAALAAVRGVDAVVITGSDDVLTEDAFRCYTAACGAGIDVAGFLQGHFFRVGGGEPDGFLWRGYKALTRPLGVGRMFSRTLLERMEWRLWPSGLNRGLDTAAEHRAALFVESRLRHRGSELHWHTMDREGVAQVVCFKGHQTLNDFETTYRAGNTEKVPFWGLAEILPEVARDLVVSLGDDTPRWRALDKALPSLPEGAALVPSEVFTRRPWKDTRPISLALMMAVWGRPSMTTACMAHGVWLRRRLIEEGVTLDLIAVCSTPEDEALAMEQGWTVAQAPNRPLGRKHNAALPLVEELGSDALIVQGSDNFLPLSLMWKLAEDVRNGLHLSGVRGAVVIDAETGDAVLREGYGGPRAHLPNGCGRMVSRTALNACGWVLWDSSRDRGLDASVHARLAERVPAWTWTLHDELPLSFKTKDALTPFSRLLDGSAGPVAVLTEKDRDARIGEVVSREVWELLPDTTQPPPLPDLPHLVLVAGVPRSGTTFMMQTLCRHLDVQWINHIIAHGWADPAPVAEAVWEVAEDVLLDGLSTESFQGRTRHPFDVHHMGYLWKGLLGLDALGRPDTRPASTKPWINPEALHDLLLRTSKPLVMGGQLAMVRPKVVEDLAGCRVSWVLMQRASSEVVASLNRVRRDRGEWGVGAFAGDAEAQASRCAEWTLDLTMNEKRRVLPVFYEDVVEDPEATARHVGDWLGIPSRKDLR